MQGGFPEQLTALRKLRELELTSVGPGAFITLPNSISNWQELRDLQLYRCGFEKLPESISALAKLDTLLIEGFRSVILLHAGHFARGLLRALPSCCCSCVAAHLRCTKLGTTLPFTHTHTR